MPNERRSLPRQVSGDSIPKSVDSRKPARGAGGNQVGCVRGSLWRPPVPGRRSTLLSRNPERSRILYLVQTDLPSPRSEGRRVGDEGRSRSTPRPRPAGRPGPHSRAARCRSAAAGSSRAGSSRRSPRLALKPRRRAVGDHLPLGPAQGNRQARVEQKLAGEQIRGRSPWRPPG